MDPIYRLPPWQATRVTTPQSEVYDWSLRAYGIPKLWAETRGKGLTVMIADTGVDTDHPDLRDNLIEAKDFTASMNGPEDVHGHGTWCCGMICAVAGNNRGVAGVANGAKFLSAKVLGDNGGGTDKTIGKALEWAMDRGGVDFISMSLGGGQMSGWLKSLFDDFVSVAGKFIFCATGNDGRRGVSWPAHWSNNIGVGAVGKDGKITRFTNTGSQLDILAAGEEMVSTVPGGYAEMTGTSMSTPFACGVSILARAKHIKVRSSTALDTVPEMREHLKRLSTPAGEFGLIDPAKLVHEADEHAVTPPPDDEIHEIDLGFLKIHIPAKAGDSLSIE